MFIANRGHKANAMSNGMYVDNKEKILHNLVIIAYCVNSLLYLVIKIFTTFPIADLKYLYVHMNTYIDTYHNLNE